jgi:cytolysin (calcineurin-like family phosphatase)
MPWWQHPRRLSLSFGFTGYYIEPATGGKTKHFLNSIYKHKEKNKIKRAKPKM